jgi:hypothetical protein
MSEISEEEVFRQKALKMVMQSIDCERRLPAHVFRGEWKWFLFFESDRIFTSEFFEIVNGLLLAEKAQVSCLLNIDEAAEFGLKNDAVFFINDKIGIKMFDDKLGLGGPAKGWIYGVDRYACASNIGEWCIYCEKNNDVAVVGLRDIDCVRKFDFFLKKLWAKPIDDLVDGGAFPLFPFNQLVPEWRKILIQNYG